MGDILGEGEEAKHTERGARGSGNGKENFLAFIWVISTPPGIKGSLTLSASSGRLINIVKATHKVEGPGMDVQKLESLFSRRALKRRMENIP